MIEEIFLNWERLVLSKSHIDKSIDESKRTFYSFVINVLHDYMLIWNLLLILIFDT